MVRRSPAASHSPVWRSVAVTAGSTPARRPNNRGSDIGSTASKARATPHG